MERAQKYMAARAEKRHSEVFTTQWHSTHWLCFSLVWDIFVCRLHVLQAATRVYLAFEVTTPRVQRKRRFIGRCDSWPCLCQHIGAWCLDVGMERHVAPPQALSAHLLNGYNIHPVKQQQYALVTGFHYSGSRERYKVKSRRKWRDCT